MMRFVSVLAIGICFSSGWIAFADDAPVQKINFEDHVKPIFREHCTSCHNASDKESDLGLDTYASTLEGGSSGKVVQENNVDGSRLYNLMAHKAQPKMPPEKDRLPDAQLDIIRKWIEQGMPENSGSAIKKPKVSGAALSMVAKGRPTGAPPMPEMVLKQTPLYTPKSAAVSALAASPWAPLVAVGGQEQVVLYHSETGELLGVLPFPEGEPQSISFSRDGQLILVAGGKHSHSGYAVLFSIKNGERITRVGDELDIVMEADISDDNKLIALGGPQKLVRIYSTTTGERLFEMKKHTDWIGAVKFSPDGVLLATADRSNGLIVWEAQTGRLYLDLVGHKGEIRSLAWRPDSSTLISSSMDGKVKFWEMVEGKEIKSIDAHAGGVAAVNICNDGTFVTTGKDTKVKVWDPAGNAAGEMPALTEAGLEVAITVDGKQIIAGDWLGNVTLWERAKPTNKFSLNPNPPTLQMVMTESQSKLDQSKLLATTAASQFTSVQQQLEGLQKQASTEEAALIEATSLLATTNQQMQQLRSDMDAQAKKMAELEAALVEARKVHAEKASNLTASEATAKALAAKKEAMEKQKVATEAALKPMVETAAQAKAAHEAAQMALSQATSKFEATKLELTRFEEYRAQVAKRESDLQAQLLQVANQVAVAEEAAKLDKSSVESMTSQIAKLQQQLTMLQQQVQQEEKKQKEVVETMAGKEKIAAELKAKLEQLQGEAAIAAEQKALFEKAFKK